MKYESRPEGEFDGIRAESESLYHIKGPYKLFDQDRGLLPVNRIYSSDDNEEADRLFDGQPYKKDRIIHEVAPQHLADNDLKNGETLVNVYGRDLLFLSDDNLEYIPSKGNDYMSESAKRVLYTLNDAVHKKSFGHHYSLGVFGSHQFGVNSVDSDMDLLAWVDWANRDELLEILTETLGENGYSHKSEDLASYHRYAKRYAERSKLPIAAGEYLADKRNRWIDPSGISTSLRCFNSAFNHNALAGFMENIQSEWHIEPFMSECSISSYTDSYNCPAIWQIDINGRDFQVVSFYIAHQGMGDDKDPDREYIIKGTKVESKSGDFLYLADQGDYIIPKDLII